ncbi:hypothetical protein TRFO_41739 [Tritrichomonas foetus]|uniref:Uncharacterized protein n=1 Tax=Tritrichomonas foetus TaxID=1144522 RepID=A0A1J4KZJ7_9EUKA|nr:hypothetical protein TRFO_41739 [Tritrichomonas foetus]|eukprot:OHT16578.1 hypothetical protein TRFO_41739 [Tritrichomonas foetus]
MKENKGKVNKVESNGKSAENNEKYNIHKTSVPPEDSLFPNLDAPRRFRRRGPRSSPLSILAALRADFPPLPMVSLDASYSYADRILNRTLFQVLGV